MIFSKILMTGIILYIIILFLFSCIKPNLIKYKNSKNTISRALFVYLIIIAALIGFYLSLFMNI